MTKAVMRDRNGQPMNSRYNAKLRVDREVDELIGICKGFIADGLINQAEAEFLVRWLETNANSANEWPANILYERVRSIFADGKLDQEEEGELLSLLVKVTGGNPTKLDAHSLTAGLPLNSPQPVVAIPGKRFCFTGKFLCGTRNHCYQQVVSRGGLIGETITVDLNSVASDRIQNRISWLVV